MYWPATIQKRADGMDTTRTFSGEGSSFPEKEIEAG
jgi:hypothetical protein